MDVVEALRVGDRVEWFVDAGRARKTGVVSGFTDRGTGWAKVLVVADDTKTEAAVYPGNVCGVGHAV